MNMGLLKAYNGLLGAFVTVFGLYHVFLPYHAIELYGEYDPAPPPPAPPSPSLRHSGARLYEHRTPATGAWFITMMGIMMILVGTCLMASRAWGSEVRAIVGSVTLALFFAILGVLLIEGPESGLPRFTASNPVHVSLVVAISLYIPALIVNRMEPGVFEWDKEARVFEESDGEDEKLTTTTGDDSPVYGAIDEFELDEPSGAVARVLARQSDYYAVLGVRKDTAALSTRKLRERYDALVNAIEKAPRGKDRENAVSVAQSAHATLANPLTRAMYDGWRRTCSPRRRSDARGRRGVGRTGSRTRAEVVRVRAEDAGGGFGVCDSDHGFVDAGGGGARGSVRGLVASDGTDTGVRGSGDEAGAQAARVVRVNVAARRQFLYLHS